MVKAILYDVRTCPTHFSENCIMKLLGRLTVPLLGICMIALAACSDASAPPLPPPDDDGQPRDSIPQTSYVSPVDLR